MSRKSLFSYSIVDQGLFSLLNRSVYYPILDRIFLVILMRIDPSGVLATFDWWEKVSQVFQHGWKERLKFQ